MALAGTLDDYNGSDLRLPTRAENATFMAIPAAAFSGSIYPNSVMAYWGPAPVGAGNGAYFPIPGDREAITGRAVRNTGTEGFLPAAGSRLMNGSSFDTGADGCYWTSSTASSVDSGYGMNFNSSDLRAVVSVNNNSGFAIRCVPEG